MGSRYVTYPSQVATIRSLFTALAEVILAVRGRKNHATPVGFLSLLTSNALTYALEISREMVGMASLL